MRIFGDLVFCYNGCFRYLYFFKWKYLICILICYGKGDGVYVMFFIEVWGMYKMNKNCVRKWRVVMDEYELCFYICVNFMRFSGICCLILFFKIVD